MDLEVEADRSHPGMVPVPHSRHGDRYDVGMTRDEIAQRIRELSVLHGNFTLRSGRTSTWYIDKYRFSTDPDILKSLGTMFAEKLPAGTNRLAGAELGGIPLVTTTSMASGLPCLFVRNQKKDYGTAKRFEGELQEGDQLALLEDVATTGGQVLEAARDLEAAGAKINIIIATVDRLEGARENIEAAGYAFESLFTVRDLGIEAD
ncbi:MAG: orotate phosphoribosyltransferase [Phycisphaerae bacterium]|nr:orotate phosphoribosyltransferase [Phycisphaerae bacterium]